MSIDDGWRDMDAVPKAGKHLPGCSLHGLMTRGKSPQRRLSLTFRLDRLPADVAGCIAGANRFSCAFNERLGALRLRPNDQGRFEMRAAPRGGGRVLLLRLPHPPRFAFSHDVAEVEPDMLDGAIIIDMPRGYGPPPKPSPGANVVPAARVGRAAGVSVIGEPEPGRSALDRRRT